MSLEVATWVTAIATFILASFAVVTAWYARKAFREQSREVAAIEQQVKDGQDISRQQSELLKVQSGQLEVLRAQLEDQHKANTAQAAVFELQTSELRESLEERKRLSEQRHRDQASRVFIWQQVDDQVRGRTTLAPEAREARRRGAPLGPLVREATAAGNWTISGPLVSAHFVNTSEQPVYDVELRWHLGSAGHGEPNPEPLSMVMPGEQVTRTREFPAGASTDLCGAVVRFTDANGSRWLRRPDGYLVKEG
jgi:hypothetical protein